MREKHMARRTESDLWKAQKSCRQLDLAKEFDTPMEAWFWPKEKKQKVGMSDSDYFILKDDGHEIILNFISPI